MRYLDPKSDVTFKKVFGEHKNLCISLLNSMLDLPNPIVSIEYRDTNVNALTEYNKHSVVDVRCEDELGRSFLVEMQLYWYESFLSRTLLNAAKTYVGQTHRAQKFKELKPVYSLCLLNDIYLKGDEYKNEFIHSYAVRHENHPDLLIKGMEFVFVELPKFRSGNKAHNKMANLWLSFLNYVQDKERHEISQELLDEPLIKEAIDYLEESSYTREERLQYDKYWDAVSTEASALDDAITKGLAEGHARGLAEGRAKGLDEGRAEGRAEGAMNERNANVIAFSKILSAQQIAETLNISLEEVEDILNKQ